VTASADAPYPELKKTHTMARRGRPWTDYKPPAAASVWAVIEGYGRYHTLVTAIDLGVFDTLDRIGAATGAELAGELGVSAEHLTTLVEGLVGMGFVERRGGCFELNDTARRYLTSDGPASMAALIPVAPGPLGNWERLADTVRRGMPARPVDDDPAAFYVPLVEATFTTVLRAATRADRFVHYSALDAPRVLDLGAGGAPWAIAVLTACPNATAVVNDLPGVIGVAARKLAEHAVAERAELRPGDYFEIGIEPGAFDVVVLGHVCRAEGADRARLLVERAFAALRPGGLVVVSDYFADRQRAHASHALMMGVTMMASTRRGSVPTFGEAAGWIRATGFEAVRLIEPIGFQYAFVARKPPTPVAEPLAEEHS
jgi:SAM-dependent methyltransferase